MFQAPSRPGARELSAVPAGRRTPGRQRIAQLGHPRSPRQLRHGLGEEAASHQPSPSWFSLCLLRPPRTEPSQLRVARLTQQLRRCRPSLQRPAPGQEALGHRFGTQSCSRPAQLLHPRGLGAPRQGSQCRPRPAQLLHGPGQGAPGHRRVSQCCPRPAQQRRAWRRCGRRCRAQARTRRRSSRTSRRCSGAAARACWIFFPDVVVAMLVCDMHVRKLFGRT